MLPFQIIKTNKPQLIVGPFGFDPSFTLPLPLRHRDLIPELLEAYDQPVILPGGETLQVIAQYGKHNGRAWIMVNERGTHKASVEARRDDPPPRLLFTTLDGMNVRLSIVE